MVGEWLNSILPMPIPAGVYGLFLLLLLLCTGIIKLGDVEHVGNLLLDIMPVMFIPASVGLLESFGAMKSILVPLVVISLISTFVVMVVTGKTGEAVLKKTGRKGDKES